MKKIVLKSYDYDKKEEVIQGQVSVFVLARSMTFQNFVDFLYEWCTTRGYDYSSGVKLGEAMNREHEHPVLHGSLVRYFIGMIVGLSHRKYFDERNEKSFAVGKKLEGMINSENDAPDHLDIGYMI